MVVAVDGTWVPLITARIAAAVTLTTALWARSEPRPAGTEHETARGKIIDRRDRLATWQTHYNYHRPHTAAGDQPGLTPPDRRH